MSTRIAGNVANRQSNAIRAKNVQAKTSGPRAALGDIGNKNKNKLVGGKAAGPSKDDKNAGRKQDTSTTQEPKIQDMDTEVVRLVAVEQSPVKIPDGVLDIDNLEDKENPQLCAEYAPVMYAYLRKVEEGLVIKKDFLIGSHINGKMRAVLVDWLIEVHSQFKLLQETLYITIYIIDRYLQQEGVHVKRNKLQLVGVTAMFLASKVEEMYAPEINDFVYITDNAYTAGEIRQMELKLLAALKFNFSRPLPLHFLRRNSKAGDVDVLQHTVAKYLVELTLLEYDMAHYPPSAVAAAALFLSLRLLEPDSTLTSVWTVTLQHYSTYTGRDLMAIVTKLAQALVRAKENKLQAVRCKYHSKKLMKVSDMPELQGEVVTKLAAKDYTDL
jgi:cyclin B